MNQHRRLLQYIVNSSLEGSERAERRSMHDHLLVRGQRGERRAKLVDEQLLPCRVGWRCIGHCQRRLYPNIADQMLADSLVPRQVEDETSVDLEIFIVVPIGCCRENDCRATKGAHGLGPCIGWLIMALINNDEIHIAQQRSQTLGTSRQAAEACRRFGGVAAVEVTVGRGF